MFGSTSTSGGLFGANKPASGSTFGASSGGFGFGNNNATTNAGASTSTGGGLFGATKPATTSFGTSSTAAPSGGLFGPNSTAASTGSTGPFGTGTSTATNTATSGFSLGPNAASNTAASTGLFGRTAASNNTTQSTGLFGASNAANSTTTVPATGGLFGANSNASTAPATGGLFGNKPAAPSGGLFGSTSAAGTTQPATGGLFGSNVTTQQQPATGGLFGGNQGAQQQAQPVTGGLFGGNQGAQQQAQPQLSTLSTSQPSFAWSQQNTSQTQGQQQQQQPLSFLSSSNDKNAASNNYAITMQEHLTKVKNSWDPTSQQTALKTYFYNRVSENQTALYTKPGYEDDDWDKAYESRPSTDSIPVRAVGFEDLQKRSQTQVNHVAQARVILQQISEKYKMLSDKHELDTASRIVAAKARHTRVSRRILRLVSTLAVLKSKGYQLSPSEEKLIQSFQELLHRSQDPSGLGKTNELWARLAILKEKAKSLSEQMDSTLGIQSNEASEDLNDAEKTQRQVLQIAKVLEEQQKGLKYLDEIVDEDQKALEKLFN
jgi:nuclear pore complex protein Nup54